MYRAEGLEVSWRAISVQPRRQWVGGKVGRTYHWQFHHGETKTQNIKCCHLLTRDLRPGHTESTESGKTIVCSAQFLLLNLHYVQTAGRWGESVSPWGLKTWQLSTSSLATKFSTETKIILLSSKRPPVPTPLSAEFRHFQPTKKSQTATPPQKVFNSKRVVVDSDL